MRAKQEEATADLLQLTDRLLLTTLIQLSSTTLTRPPRPKHTELSEFKWQGVKVLVHFENQISERSSATGGQAWLIAGPFSQPPRLLAHSWPCVLGPLPHRLPPPIVFFTKPLQCAKPAAISWKQTVFPEYAVMTMNAGHTALRTGIASGDFLSPAHPAATGTRRKRQKLYLLLEATLTGGSSGVKGALERRFLLWRYPAQDL